MIEERISPDGFIHLDGCEIYPVSRQRACSCGAAQTDPDKMGYAVGKRRPSGAYNLAVRLFDRTCDMLWWMPGVPRLWAFVANRTVSLTPTPMLEAVDWP